MSVFSDKRGWRYDFVLKKRRYQSNYFRTKSEAKEAEAKHRHKLKKGTANQTTQTDMDFLDLLNKRLDFIQNYRSKKHYQDHIYRSKIWVKLWSGMKCSEITREMVEQLMSMRRSTLSAHSANCDLRTLRAIFNWGIKRGIISHNPTAGIEFMPVTKKVKYVPPQEDVDKVIEAAEPDTRDYLWTIRDTLGRMSEVNRLTWDDIDFTRRSVTLYTSKKKGGHLTPRTVPMTERLYFILRRRFDNRDESKPWVFWHTYWSSKTGEKLEGPYKDRKRIMKSLCQKAGVRYFRFHALRHASASVLDNGNVPLGSIQRILGHENRETTEIYLHSIGNSEREAIGVLEQVSKKSLANPSQNEKSTHAI